MNYVGSMFFMLSAIASFTLTTTGEEVNTTIVNSGTFAGAVCFLVGAYLFSGAIALQLQLQAEGWELSRYLLESLPYLTVLLVLALLSRRRTYGGPAALEKVFEG